jgi:hypothetical protein
MKSVIAAAALLCLGITPAVAKSPCAEQRYKPVSNAARSGLQRLAPPAPGARAAVGNFYDASQCLSVRGGKKIRDWAAEKRRQRAGRN